MTVKYCTPTASVLGINKQNGNSQKKRKVLFSLEIFFCIKTIAGCAHYASSKAFQSFDRKT